MAAALPALEAGEVDRFFAQVTPVSIDVGVLERSRQVAVVAGDFAWDDIGTWEALARVRPADPAGNVTAGPVTAVDARDNVVWSDGTPVVVAGVSGLVVVHANNRVLVIDRRHAADLKRVLDALPPEVREV
jgi:mannose-1-phosphate guanylyltransferase